MGKLFLLRGLPGSGKSTWIAQNQLEYMTVSSDQVRIDNVGFEPDECGINRISQRKPHVVWSIIWDDIERRMSAGEDVILDSTMLKSKDMRKYEPLLLQYGYSGYVVDFTDVDVSVCKARNAAREDFRIVPDAVISKMTETLAANTVPPSYEEISPDEAANLIFGASG